MSNRARLIAVATVLLAIAFACLAPPKKQQSDEAEPSTLSLRLKKTPARETSSLVTSPKRQPRSNSVSGSVNPLRPKPYPTSGPQAPLEVEHAISDVLTERYKPIITEALKVSAASKSTITIKVEDPSHDANTQVTKVKEERQKKSVTGFVTGNRTDISTAPDFSNGLGERKDSKRIKEELTGGNYTDTIQAQQNKKEQSNHKVRDGDTLQSIATRYLGSESRYLEIYDLNRDILIAPDVLPIGLELRLPQASNSSSESSLRKDEPGPEKADLREVKIDTSILPISRDEPAGKPP